MCVKWIERCKRVDTEVDNTVGGNRQYYLDALLQGSLTFLTYKNWFDLFWIVFN